MYKLHRIERFRLQGLCYETWVFRSGKGYTMQTSLGIGGRIISDGNTETEAFVSTGGCCQSRYWLDNYW